jgi:hypothetical protein
MADKLTELDRDALATRFRAATDARRHALAAKAGSYFGGGDASRGQLAARLIASDGLKRFLRWQHGAGIKATRAEADNYLKKLYGGMVPPEEISEITGYQPPPAPDKNANPWGPVPKPVAKGRGSVPNFTPQPPNPWATPTADTSTTASTGGSPAPRSGSVPNFAPQSPQPPPQAEPSTEPAPEAGKASPAASAQADQVVPPSPQPDPSASAPPTPDPIRQTPDGRPHLSAEQWRDLVRQSGNNPNRISNAAMNSLPSEQAPAAIGAPAPPAPPNPPVAPMAPQQRGATPARRLLTGLMPLLNQPQPNRGQVLSMIQSATQQTSPDSLERQQVTQLLKYLKGRPEIVQKVPELAQLVEGARWQLREKANDDVLKRSELDKMFLAVARRVVYHGLDRAQSGRQQSKPAPPKQDDNNSAKMGMLVIQKEFDRHIHHSGGDQRQIAAIKHAFKQFTRGDPTFKTLLLRADQESHGLVRADGSNLDPKIADALTKSLRP